MGIVSDLIFILITALLGGLVARLCRQPLIFGYMLAGVLVGPYTGGITIQNVHDIEMLAELGVALLLFTLGLQFSFKEFKRVSRIAFLATPLQIILCASLGYLIATRTGFSHRDAIWLGAAISLSSTMVVLKILSARRTQSSNTGRIMLAILIAQDLALLPIMLILPQITMENFSLFPIASALGEAALFLAFMYLGDIYVFPRLFKGVTSLQSRELFFLCTLAFALGAGYLAHTLGLSFALGAFIAGMLLSDTDFSQEALDDVATLRDLFALIFFVSVGMLFDPAFFISHSSQILLLTCAVVVLKALMIAGTVRLLGYSRAFAWTIGLGLSQVGEFAFVIAKAGSTSGALSHDTFALVIAVTVISMAATPAFFWLGDRLLGVSKIQPPSQSLPQESLIRE
jgi:CPA2 family monovalent cation:H+ antiporter-2